MSKLFPMFKKKGKGRDDDTNEEEPKRKGKRERVREALSPSKENKHKKKGKGNKEVKAHNGKVNESISSSHSIEEAEVQIVDDFYVDDEGMVKLGPMNDRHNSFVDEVMSSVEESFSQEHERSFGTYEENADESVFLRDEKEEEDGLVSQIPKEGGQCDVYQSNDRISENSNDLNGKSMVTSMTSSCYSQNSDECAEVQAGGCETISDRKDIDNGIIYLETAQSSVTAVSEKPDTESYMAIEESSEFLDHGIVINTHSDLEMNNLPAEKNTDESITPVVDDEIEVLSLDEKVSESLIVCEKEAEISVNLEIDNDKIDEDTEDISEEYLSGRSWKHTNETVTSSHDSDDDFDSAQEDWDEDELDCNKTEEGSAITSKSLEGEIKSPPIHEATNTVLVEGEISCSSDDGRDRIASEYEDARAVLSPNSIENPRIRKISSSGKLERKLSNISVASSDAFNEELDDLLDEELDRLSEEEEAGLDIKAEHNNEDNKNTDDIHLESPKDTSAQDSVDVSIVDAGENNIETPELDKTVIDNCDVDSAHSSPIIDSHSPSCDSNINQTEADNTDTTATVNHLSAPEENSEQVKDSGYYSLPVSPNLGALVRANGDSEQEITTKVVDDSFGDSEEEGMITPPSEASIIEKMTETPSKIVTEAEEVNDESSVPNQMCCEKQESAMNVVTVEESKTEATHANINDTNETEKDFDTVEVNDTESTEKNTDETINGSERNDKETREDQIDAKTVNESEKNDQKICEDQIDAETISVPKLESQPLHPTTPKQSVDLKVIIPKDGEKKDEKGIKSPKCESPTKLRVKSPLKESDSPFSLDPVGDRFLNEAVLLSHEDAEARLAQRRAARAEARELRLRELEKQQQDQENEEEKQFGTAFAEPSPRAAVANRTSAGRTSALNSTGQYSRRSSEDSTTDEAALPANVREMKAELKELDDKFRKAMITNAQLDNEKSTLTYEVELIKDKYTELEESHTQLTKEHRRKCTEYEQLKKVSAKLQEEVKILRGMLQERDQLIQEYGLRVVGEEEEENGEATQEEIDEFPDMDNLTPRKLAVKKVLLSQEAAELLEKGASKGSLDIRLKKFGEEKNDLEDQVRRLKLELEEERNNNRRKENGLDYEKAKEQSKTLNEYKFRVQKAEAEVLTLQANVARLDALSTRYKSQSEELEKSEEDLKIERRKLQRELRDAQNRLEEIETTNNHLIKRFDKLKNARSNLLKDLSQDPA